jgi:hypothetical protein
MSQFNEQKPQVRRLVGGSFYIIVDSLFQRHANTSVSIVWVALFFCELLQAISFTAWACPFRVPSYPVPSGLRRAAAAAAEPAPAVTLGSLSCG